ncbi:Ig-like domain-containing protein [Pyxidicoccus trucidator]|uniref:Ig-like domain-containing protein n=1 Tax=Pyxidicoccus trucidator TaxID=2709662 RepID=UPI0013DCEF83|nr:Ig-like domain-containing protein [Pyxidicoccus trucidator]
MFSRHTLAILASCLLVACGVVEPESSETSTATLSQELSGFTGPTSTSHQYPELVLLNDGRALVADSSKSEFYNPSTNTWTATPPLNTPRTFHSLITLADGRVLAAGGMGGNPYGYLPSAELFEPQTNTWTPTGSLTTGRQRAQSARLADGRVLMMGGQSTGGVAVSSAEIYDPATGTWSSAGNSHYSCAQGTATLLLDGRVLLMCSPGAQLFDPASNTFTKVGTSANGRINHLAALLQDGRVLFTGGSQQTTELFDPALLQFTTTGSMANSYRMHMAGTVLADGTVLVAGGYGGPGVTLGSVERYHPATGTWMQGPVLAQKREYARMVQLATGDALVVGGSYSTAPGSSMVINNPQVAELISLSTCAPTTCAAQGKNCGTIPDGCGGTLSCGTCGAGQACSASNVCVCVPTTCAAQNRTCGAMSDGCGGTLDCGTCGAGSTCDTGPGVCVPGQPGNAQYDATLKVPACTGELSTCDSGTLLVGRGSVGAEPNAPNTLGGTCADGTGGSFHVDESLDRLKVRSLDGGPFTAGRTVIVDATVWAFSGFSTDYLDIYSAADASNPSWVFVATVSPTMAGSQVLSTSFVLPNGARQAVRGVFRYGSSVGPCVAGSYNDRDDLVFPVVNPVDTQSPTVSLTSPAPGATVRGQVVLQATANDDVGVTRVEFYVQTNTPGALPALVGSDTTVPYSVTWNTLLATPASSHLLTARAYDAAGNVTVSALQVNVVDNTAPSVTLDSPLNGATVSGTVTLAATAQDYSGIQSVTFYVDGQAAGTDTSAPYSVAWNAGSVSAGTHTVHAVAWDVPGNSASSQTASITAPGTGGPIQATYSATWRAPSCAGVVGPSCDSGTLLTGRANLGPELNAPNTVGSSCADGATGTFHGDESLDRLVLATVDGGALRAGTAARLTATVWAFSTSDVLDVYSAPSAASPVWTLVGTASAPASGLQSLSVTYTLPAGSTQVVRAVFRYGGTSSPCPTGQFDDKDDLVFSAQ